MVRMTLIVMRLMLILINNIRGFRKIRKTSMVPEELWTTIPKQYPFGENDELVRVVRKPFFLKRRSVCYKYTHRRRPNEMAFRGALGSIKEGEGLL